MRQLLADALHIFVIIMMAAFIVGGLLATTGTFDHWGSRYVLKRRRQRLLRNRRADIRNANAQQPVNKAPYYAPPERRSVNYKGKYA